MLDLQIRRETPADSAAIDAVTRAAFENAPHTSHTEQFIVAALRRSGHLAFSLVAQSGAQVIGHVAVSPVHVADGTDGWFGLGPLSVLPSYQRQGVGSRLMREVLQALRAHHASGCVVLGDPAYYGRFGFAADPALQLPDVPPAYFMALPLTADRARGTVRYDPAFDARS